MKKFIFRFIITSIILVAVDQSIGFVCRYCVKNAKYGATRKLEYIANECQKDIIIMGSSRAAHHYIPHILEDSLGMTCYNCGYDGNGIILMYSRLLMLTERYTPKIILYDLNSFDINVEDNSKYLKAQKRYYDKTGISEVFNKVNPLERYKMCSQMYRYNEDFALVMQDFIRPQEPDIHNGYLPTYGSLTSIPTIQQLPPSHEWDEVKKECLLQFIDKCDEKGIKLFFFQSPCFGGCRPTYDELVQNFIRSNNLVMLDFYSNENFCFNPHYFSDTVHMNDSGATAYSKMVASRLLEILNL